MMTDDAEVSTIDTIKCIAKFNNLTFTKLSLFHVNFHKGAFVGSIIHTVVIKRTIVEFDATVSINETLQSFFAYKPF
jgi:hypothetical protein